MAIVTNTDKIAALYVSYFDRAPDPDGLSYWVGRLNAGMSLNDIANSFAQQPEAIANYAYLAAPNIGGVPAAQAFINTIYENLFNRAADAPGLAYWTTQLTSGAVAPGLMIEAIIGGAQGSDVTVMNNKVTVGEAYADAFVAHNDTWTGIDDLVSAKAALAGGSVFGGTFVQVDATAGSVATNVAQIALLAAALQNDPLQIVINPSVGSVVSGNAVDFVITEAPSQAGKTVHYALGGAGTTGNEIGIPLSGNVTLDSNGRATLHVPTLVVATNLGLANDDLNLTIGGQTSSDVVVIHGTQTVAPGGPTTVNEGSTFNVTIGTSLGAVAAGLVETYTVAGSGLAQIPVADQSGTVTLDSSGQFVLTLHTLANVFNSPNPDPTITVTVNGVSTGTITIHEAAQQAVTASNITEGQTTTFNIATTGVDGSTVVGTTETWTLTGDAFVLSQLTGPTSGTVTLAADGTAAVSVGTSFTVFNLGGSNSGQLTFNLFNNAAPVVSQNVTVTEATLTVTTSSTPVLEGQQVTFTLNGTNVPNGFTTHYTVSGAAIGNVTSPTSGFVTINGDTATIVLNTLSNDISGLTKGLTLTLDTIPTSDPVNLPVMATALIAETAPASFILTTGTDNLTGNPSGDNTFFATAGDAGATLGQNDNLNGGGNVAGHPNTLFLTSTGTTTLNVGSFSTQNIQVFNINAANSSGNGTRIDMSSAQGVQTVLDQNSSGTVGLLNVQNQITLEIRNPSDLGHAVDLGLQYVSGQLANVNNSATGQVVILDPTVSPITGMPNTVLDAPGVTKFTINSNPPGNGNNSASFNGLAGINQPLQNAGAPFNTANPLGQVTMLGTVSFVLGGFEVDQVGAAFTQTNSLLDLSAFQGAFYDVGDPDPARFEAIDFNGGGTFTVLGGAGKNDGNSNGRAVAMEAFYANSNGGTLGPLLGGSNPGNVSNATILSTDGNILVQVDGGTFMGQALRATGSFDSISVLGINGGAGGFVDDFNTGVGGLSGGTSIRTNQGTVTVADFNGGLGSVFTQSTSMSFIVTNTNAGNGGFIDIHNVNGGIDLQISSGNARADIEEAGNTGNMVLDFHENLLGAAANTGFHGGINFDIFNGGTGTNTLVFSPNINNNSNGEGSATNLNNLILESDTGTGAWNPAIASINGGAGVNPANSVGLAQLGNGGAHGPINVFIGGNGAEGSNPVSVQGLPGPIDFDDLAGTNFTFTGAVNNENFVISTEATGTLNDTLSLDFGNTVGNAVNVVVQGQNNANNHLTISDFAVNDFSGNKNSSLNNPLTRLNFTSTVGSHFSGTATTLTLDTLNALTTLFLAGDSNLIVNDTATQAATIKTIDGTGDDSNVDITGLMTAADTNSPGGTKYLNPGTGAADALFAGGGNIHLGLGSNKIAVAGGTWNITSDGAGTTIVVNPKSGDIDTIHATGGGDTITVGANNGSGGVAGGGQVSITTNNGGNTFVFDQQGLPQLQSADLIHAGNGAGGNDKIQIINGSLFFFDAGFSQVTGVEQLQLAAGFSNGLQLDFNANNDVLTNQTGQLEVITGGGGNLLSSTAINVGAGFNSPLLVTIGASQGNGGDAGGDTITTHLSSTPGSNPLTVSGTATDLDVSFLSSATTIQGGPEGIFASTSANNTVKVIADNGTLDAFGGASGINGVQNIVGVHEANPLSNNNLTVWLVNNAVAAANPENVNLSAVTGNTVVLGQALSAPLNIDGGTGNGSKTNILLGGSGADTITGHGTGTNVIYGGAKADTLVGNGANGATDIFVYNALSDSQGGQVPSDADNITFHPGSDTFSINPATLANGAVDFVGPSGGAASLAEALTYLNPADPDAQAVLIATGANTGQLWIDANADGNLNQADYEFNITFASSPSLSQSNFTETAPTGTKFNTGGTLLYTASTFQTTIAAWNITPPPAVITTVQFIGVGGSVLANPPNVTNYDFSGLLSGVSFTTPEFNGNTPVMPAGKVTGSGFDDQFFVNNLDLANGFVVDGGAGTDQITIDPPGPLTFTISSTSSGAGKGQVDHVETLNLIDTLGNTITFEGSHASGNDFKNINGSSLITGPNVINNLFATGGSQNFNAGGKIDFSKDKGKDIVNLGTDLALSTILLDGLGTVDVNFSGALTTTITGLHNLDEIVLGGGNVAHDLSGALITDVNELDMTASTSAIVTLSTAQVGGLKGFLAMDLATGGGAHIVLTPNGNPVAADFTNVTLNTLNFKLGVGANDTVMFLHNEIPLQGIDGGGSTDKFIITDNGDFSLEGAKYNNLGSVSWQTGELEIDNSALVGTNPHGITELHGNGTSSLEVEDNVNMNLAGLTAWDGINHVVVDLGLNHTLTVNSAEAVSVGALNGDFHAETGNFNQNLTINSTTSYDLGHSVGLSLTNEFVTGLATFSSWKGIDFDGTNQGHITVSASDLVFDASQNAGILIPNTPSITDVHGDSVANPTDVLNITDHFSNSSIVTDLSSITTFDGFHDVHVNEQFTGGAADTFHLTDVISSYTFLHGGTSTLNLGSGTSLNDVAWLNTSGLSAQTNKAGTGFNTDWDITGFNAGNSTNHSILQITDTTTALNTSVSGSQFINSSAGTQLNHSAMNVINTNVATSTNLLDLTNNGNVETALASVAGLKSDGLGLGQVAGNANAHVYVILQGSGAFNGEAGIYEINMDTTAGHLTNGTTLAGHTNDFSVNLIGIIHTPGDSLQNQNFA